MAGFQLWLGGGGGLDIVATTATDATSGKLEHDRVASVVIVEVYAAGS